MVDLDGAAVLKIFPPVYRNQYVSESAALHQLSGRLSVSTPDILAEGEGDGWSWLIMTRMTGVAGSSVWPELDDNAKEIILADAGRTIAEVHAMPVGRLEHVRLSWPDFIRKQVDGCVEKHRGQGFPERFLDELGVLASNAVNVIPLHAANVILTGDWIPQNFLLSDATGNWRVSGVIDFGDVRTGWGEYDLLAPSAITCEGKAQLVRSLFDGYGIVYDQGGDALRHRLLTLLVLHQESDFRNMVLPDWEDRISRVSDLASLIWPEV